MNLVKNSAPHSFNALYLKYYKKALLFTKSFVHDEFIAEDIISESLIKCWENLKGIEDPDHIDALVLTILKNKSLDYLKHETIKHETINQLMDQEKRELELRIYSLQACDPNEVFSNEIKQIIAKTLAELPTKTRQVFIMSRFQNKSNKLIANELNTTIKGVEYHITKALKYLRVSLKDYLPILQLFLS
ncbi:MAG: RNA polymerase sigma-70 factor [Massilibacteroides sp.]|nr:RNA polymerase sigma-70 factor [Massilibacteroides sp.]MDD3063966.1 RNA polymerase sigma-70 factor [Massilibacteroides sp.]